MTMSFTTENERPIAVFDSGVGGVSVLRELRRVMPRERYLYYGDSANAPYGEKSPAWILARVNACVGEIMTYTPKALVVACNTATGVAIAPLRERFRDLPIVGIEPAVKPAAERFPGGTIAVMATPVTLKQPKFKSLLEIYADKAHFFPLPCPGLAETIEKGGEVLPLLRQTFSDAAVPAPDALVLGCTHYPLIPAAIRTAARETWGRDPVVMDGGRGTALQTARLLTAAGRLAPESQCGSVTIVNTAGASRADAARRFLEPNENDTQNEEDLPHDRT